VVGCSLAVVELPRAATQLRVWVASRVVPPNREGVGMYRLCIGEDPNLVRVIDQSELTPDMRLSPWIHAASKEGQVAIFCACGTAFDDTERFVIYPHDPLPVAEQQLAALAELFHQLMTARLN
jgi:hypothetical protein